MANRSSAPSGASKNSLVSRRRAITNIAGLVAAAASIVLAPDRETTSGAVALACSADTVAAPAWLADGPDWLPAAAERYVAALKALVAQSHDDEAIRYFAASTSRMLETIAQKRAPAWEDDEAVATGHMVITGKLKASPAQV